VKPVPAPTAVTKPYWDAAREGRLLLQRCTSCGAVTHYPRPLCPSCWSSALEWVDASGRGRVHSATVVHHPPSPAFPVPYVLAIVELEEGPRMMANVLGGAPVGIGAAVRLTFERRGDFALPQFELVD